MLPTQTLDNEGQIQVVAKVSVMDPALLALFNAGMADNAAVRDTVVALEAETEEHRDAVILGRNATELLRDEVQTLTDTTTGLAAAASDSAVLASNKATAASVSAAAALASEQAAESAKTTAIAQAGSATASAEASAISASGARTSRLAAEEAEQSAKDSLAATNTARTATETARNEALALETQARTAKNAAETAATTATTQAGVATNHATNADLSRQAAEAARTRAVAAEAAAINKATEATNRADEAAADAVQTDSDRSAVVALKEETNLLVMNARAAKEGAEIAQSSSESSAQTAGIAAQNAATSAGSASSSALAAAASAVLASDHVDAAALSETNAQTAATTAVEAKDRAVQAETTVVNNINAATQAAQSTAADLVSVSGHRTHVDTVVGQFDIDAAAAIQAAETARQGAEAAAASIPANAITDAPVDGKQYVRQDANWAEVVIPEDTGGGSIDETLVPIRHDFGFTGLYQDAVAGVTGYLINGVMDPIDFPGDISTTTYFGSLPTTENSSFFLKRRVFNSPNVGPGGFGAYTDGDGLLLATSDAVGVFATYGGEPAEWMTPVYNAHYTSSPVVNGMPGVVNPTQMVKQSIHYMIEKSSAMYHMTRTRTLYRESALDPWEIGMDWDDEYFDPDPEIPAPDMSWEILPYATLPSNAPASPAEFKRNTTSKPQLVTLGRTFTEAGQGNNYYATYRIGTKDPALVTNFYTDPEWTTQDVPVTAGDGYYVSFVVPPGAWYAAYRNWTPRSSNSFGAFPREHYESGVMFNGNNPLDAWLQTFLGSNSAPAAIKTLGFLEDSAPSVLSTSLNTLIGFGANTPNNFVVIRATILPQGTLEVREDAAGSFVYATVSNNETNAKDVTITFPLKSATARTFRMVGDSGLVTINSCSGF